MSRVLIAGMGNILRGDDGFGVEAARRLGGVDFGRGGEVKVIEVGIGGIHLVQELMDGYDVLIVIDALARNSAPGTLHLLEAEVPDLDAWPEAQRQDFLADMHYTTPSKALILAKALGVLPTQVYLVGCQPSEVEEFGIGFSEPVQRAVDAVTGAVQRLVQGQRVEDLSRS